MNCEKYQNLLSDLIDGSLTPTVCDEVEAHLRACATCLTRSPNSPQRMAALRQSIA